VESNELSRDKDGDHSMSQRILLIDDDSSVRAALARILSSQGYEVTAATDGADFLFAGPVFDTPSKSGLVPTLGLERLAEICRTVDLPVIGLGGIDALNAAEVIRAGTDGVAVIRAILAADDPGAAAARLVAALPHPSHPWPKQSPNRGNP
jgi:thiamine-phosphate diphosphorylase